MNRERGRMMYEIAEQTLSRSGRVVVGGRQNRRGRGRAGEKVGQGVCALGSKVGCSRGEEGWMCRHCSESSYRRFHWQKIAVACFGRGEGTVVE